MATILIMLQVLNLAMNILGWRCLEIWRVFPFGVGFNHFKGCYADHFS